MLIEEYSALSAVLSYLVVLGACAVIAFIAADVLWRTAQWISASWRNK